MDVLQHEPNSRCPSCSYNCVRNTRAHLQMTTFARNSDTNRLNRAFKLLLPFISSLTLLHVIFWSRFTACLGGFLLRCDGRFGPDEPRYVSDLSDDIVPKRFGVVIAVCDKSLGWLKDAGIACKTHDVFLYVRCPGKSAISLSTVPSRLGDCVFVDVLQNVSNVTGKAHQAYLAHIVRRWDNLNNVTAFLKDSNVHSLQACFSAEGIAFTTCQRMDHRPGVEVKGSWV